MVAEHLECIFKNLLNIKMIMHIQSPGIVRTVYSSIFLGYLGLFRDIDAYSATLRGVQLGRRGEAPLLFLKINNSILILEIKSQIVSIIGLSFPFKMLLEILRNICIAIVYFPGFNVVNVEINLPF